MNNDELQKLERARRADPENESLASEYQRLQRRSNQHNHFAVINGAEGNIHALDSVLADIRRRKIKKIFHIGSLFGWGPHPVQVLKRLREEEVILIRGYFEHAVYHAPQRLTGFRTLYRNLLIWNKQQLLNAKEPFPTLPETLTYGEFSLMWGSPKNPCAFPIETSSFSLNPHFSLNEAYGLSSKILIVGSARPARLVSNSGHSSDANEIDSRFDWDREEHLVLNCGQVGMSIPGGQPPSWLELDDNMIHWHLTDYDAEAAAFDANKVSYLGYEMAARLTGRLE
ncbi:MAG: hypothetical protein P1V97_24310 [Planctomycetota bacterium]|nr:hypothetical protein [Planctomycetota bacterium]